MTETPRITPPAPDNESGAGELRPEGGAVSDGAQGKPPRRRQLWNTAGAVVALVGILGVLGLWIHTAQFQDMVRSRLALQLQAVTGGRVEMGSFHWRPLRLDAEARGIVIHGDEQPGDEPYARIDDLTVKFSILGIWSPAIRLRELDIVRPRVHLIFYPDGATNQPHPVRQRKSNPDGMDTLFKLKAGRIAVEQGMVHLDNRAAELDFKNRYEPLDFLADDLDVSMDYAAAAGGNPERYHIATTIGDVALRRGVEDEAPQARGSVEASIDLQRDQVRIVSLRITSSMKGTPDRQLNIAGSVSNFSHPVWEAKIAGEIDLGLLDPALGYDLDPDGVARVDLSAGGRGSGFHVDGAVHATRASYIGPGVDARGIDLSTHVHADENWLRVTDVTARLAQGGSLEGEVLLEHWLPPTKPDPGLLHAPPPPAPVHHHAGAKPLRRPVNPAAHQRLVKTPIADISVNGTVNAVFHNVPLDGILDIVGQAPFKRLGLASLTNGPARATWVNGDVNTLSVTSKLNLAPSTHPGVGEVPAAAALDATFTQRDGSVDVRSLTVSMPGSHVEAHGRVGAYPLTSPTALTVSVQSDKLGEFDTVLRDLGLHRAGKVGAEALPVALGGHAEFQGTWAGSLLSPRIDGNLAASDITLELPAGVSAGPGQARAEARTIHWDSVTAQGAYDAENVAIVHGELRRGLAHLEVSGTLSATPGAARSPGAGGVRAHVRPDAVPAFSSDSVLHARIQAQKVPLTDLLSLTGTSAPVTGSLDAEITAEGPLRSIGGTGWAQLNDAVVDGEPVRSVRAQGSLEGRTVKLTSLAAALPAGSISGSGSYNLDSGQFQIQARSAGLEVARIERVGGAYSLQGRLEFSLTASGTAADPGVEGHASIAGLVVRGQPVGAVNLNAHTANHLLVYDADSQTDAAQVKAHGQIEMKEPWVTQSQVEFSQLDAGAFLRMAHVEAVTAKSALAGNATLQGPLGRLREMSGSLSLNPADIVLSGVRLRSDGPIRATLGQARITLAPVHVTGDDTDLRAEGSLSLEDTHKVDLAARGSVNLKLAETLDPRLTASGSSTFQVEAHGTLSDPGLRGQVQFHDGALALEDLPNGLSQLNGILEFSQNRLEVKSVTATTGGGQLSLGGYLAYQRGLYADLTVTGRSVRVRYPQGVSSLADADLRVQGTRANLLLSGNVLITRFSVSPDLDIASLAAQATTSQAVAPPDAPSNHVRLDVRVLSSPQLNFQNAYAKLAGDVDLRLRGTLASPALLGRISITEGSAIIAGTRYELQRGEVSFSNPVRIQPSIDLNATARVEDYDITLGLHGTPEKMSVTYRSDPPLPEADVVALLALGRTQSESGLYTQQQQQSAGLSPSTDVLLGGALNATVSSRVQRLFGAGSVKVDPSYLGALGNSTTRITVEEQLGKNVTLTYATNVDTSAQQLLQAEFAINRHVSLQVTRDESGVFSMVVKATRRYK